jgi:hypothetical protein
MHAAPFDPLLPTSRKGAPLWAGAGVLAFAAVTVAPVATFLVLIVGFGLLHVLAELRYVDQRFAGRFDRRWLWLMLGLVGCIAAIRAALYQGVIPYGAGIAAETVFGCALALLGMIMLKRHRLAVGLGVLAFAALAFVSPLHALLTIAVLHNLTPLGFLAERLPGPQRRTTLLLLSVPFVAIPLVLATGAPSMLVSAWTGLGPDWTPAGFGPAEAHLGAFLPPELIGTQAGYHAFAGAVFAQIMHYLAVIVVLPRLQTQGGAALVPWPEARTFWIGAGAVCLALIAFYLSDYGQAKSFYGLFAAIHSWIEVPILIAALSLSEQVQPQTK